MLQLPDEGHGHVGGPILTRRRFLRCGALAAACIGIAPRRGAAVLAASGPPERWLAFYNLHTGESLKAMYWARGEYLPEPLAEINHILRDYRTGETRAMDVRLLDLLHQIVAKLETRQPLHVISGYRSPATNAMLRRRTSGVAEHSQHMEGRAADIRVPDRDLLALRRLAAALHEGGVGFYPRSGFVHVDVGRVRSW
jgi:uncharacterized protein YcbK (DUF882 family)